MYPILEVMYGPYYNKSCIGLNRGIYCPYCRHNYKEEEFNITRRKKKGLTRIDDKIYRCGNCKNLIEMQSRKEFENKILALEKLRETFSNLPEILKPIPKSKTNELRRQSAEMFGPYII